ncbi:oxygenase MpaB family protein [Nocardia sp. NPDC046473]|uniref:oxygenase MpaB family protein n=1 Tax=Nocardia sp. NPDC046473 TaxID=3155733 RepID=UPI0033FEF27F
MTSQSARRTLSRKATTSAESRPVEPGDRTGTGTKHAAARIEEPSALLAPGSVTYRVLGDAGTMTYVSMAGMVLGTLMPKVGRGIEEHEPLLNGDIAPAGTGHSIRRLFDSYELLAGIVLGATAQDRADAANALRELHRKISGTMPDGARYHAWERETWAYAWTGIFQGVIEAYDFSRGFTCDTERDEALAGMVELGRSFGVQGIPDTREEFDAYWTDYLCNVAENNPTVEWIMKQMGPETRKPASAPWIPQPVWRVITFPLRRLLRVGALATFPEVLDERLGLHRTRIDAVELALHKGVWRLVPKALSQTAGPIFFRARQHIGPKPPWQNRFSRDNLAHRRAELDIVRAESDTGSE